jgi:nicotinamidase-related amidase
MIVVDMQVGLLDGLPKHDLPGVLQRINLLTAIVREHSGTVTWIRHCGKPESGFERHTKGWSFLPELRHHRDDVVVEKTLNDPFVRTSLQEVLRRIAPVVSSSQAGQPTAVSIRRSVRPYRTTTTSLLLPMVTQ